MTAKKCNLPTKFKFYEAFGVIADQRMEYEKDDKLIIAKSYSSSRNKFYQVIYNASENSIMTNDNLTWYKNALGYPALTLLVITKKIVIDTAIVKFFKDIPFKDINQRHKNDFMKSKVEIDDLIKQRGGNIDYISEQINSAYFQLENLNLNMLGNKIEPPKGY